MKERAQQRRDEIADAPHATSTDLRSSAIMGTQKGRKEDMALAIAYEEELEELRSGFGLTEKELATALETTPRTLRRWLAGASVPRPEGRERIEDLLDVLRTLRMSVREEAVPKWVRRRVDLLGGDRPADLIVEGDFHRLLHLADGLATGTSA